MTKKEETIKEDKKALKEKKKAEKAAKKAKKIKEKQEKRLEKKLMKKPIDKMVLIKRIVATILLLAISASTIIGLIEIVAQLIKK